EKDLVHVENHARAATLGGQRGPHEKVGQRVHVDHLDASELRVRRDETAAAAHEVTVFAQIGKECPARLPTGHANRDDAVDALYGRLGGRTNGDHGQTFASGAQRLQLALDARVRGVVPVDQMQNLDPLHAGQLDGSGVRAKAGAA